MTLAFEKQVAKLDDAVLLASRLLLAWLFVHEGATLASNFGPAAEGMSKMGVPPSLLIATIALQLLGGIAIAIGWQARLGAVGLGLFCLATAVLFHQNFAVRNELLHFEKDLAIAGGMFVLMVRGAGAWSLDGFFLRATKFAAATAESILSRPRGQAVKSVHKAEARRAHAALWRVA